MYLMNMGAANEVTEIALPPKARELSLLPRLDYTDCFVVDAPGIPELTAERWAREMIQGAPGPLRDSLRSGWRMLGLKHGSAADPDRILGWELRRREPDSVLLHADSRIGMPGELLYMRMSEGILFATFIQQRNPVAKAVWASIASGHRRIVAEMLGRAAERLQPASSARAVSATESSIGRGSQPSSLRARSLDM